MEENSEDEQEDKIKISNLLGMLENAEGMTTNRCSHANCNRAAKFGDKEGCIASRCRLHKGEDDVLLLRVSVAEKRGDWEEIVDNATGQTYYFNRNLDKIIFEKPKNWVRMVAQHFELMSA